MKRTPWFSAKKQPPMPGRPGFYEVRWAGWLCQVPNDQMWWTGKTWKYTELSVFESAFGEVHEDRWRGILKDDS